MMRNLTAAVALAVLCSSLLDAQAPATCLSFKEAVNVETGLFASGVVIDDFNADGAADLAVTNQNANNVSVLLGDGTGAFKRKTDFAAGGAPQRIAAADLDGDRNLDLVLPITAGNAVAILFGDREGHFAEPKLLPVVGGPFMIVIADFNADSRLDLAVGTQTAGSRKVALLMGRGARTSARLPTLGPSKARRRRWALAISIATENSISPPAAGPTSLPAPTTSRSCPATDTAA